MKRRNRRILALAAAATSFGVSVGVSSPGASGAVPPHHRPGGIPALTTPAATTPTARTRAPGPTTISVVDDRKRFTVHAFDINADADDLIPAPGTPPGTVSSGDETVIDDQLTSTRDKNGGYPIVGYDSGTCVYTRTAPDGQSANSPFNTTIESCLATSHLPQGTLTATGVITDRAGKPMPASITILGGTGRYVDAGGTISLAFGKDFNTYIFEVR